MRQTPIKHGIGLVGQGNIARGVLRHLDTEYVQIIACLPEDEQLPGCSFIVYCSDIWAPQELQRLNQRCLQAKRPLLPVYTQFGEAIIGPCVIPGEKGCTSCAELCKLGATYADTDRELLHQYLYHEQAPPTFQPWLSSFSLEILGTVVAREVLAYLQHPEQLQTRRALLSLPLTTLDCQRHPFVPLSSCPACGGLASDSEQEAVIALQSRHKSDVFTYRAQIASATPQDILSTYVDEQTGLIYSLTVDHTATLPITATHLHYELQDGREPTQGTGCTLRTQQSKVISVLESIERYAGMRPRSKRAAIHASYHQLLQQGRSALDPNTLGLQEPECFEQHEQQCCHMQPYHHDLEFNWVWGYSFQHRAPLLVPEQCVYYGLPHGKDNPTFIYEVSNGCALGNNLEEAIFHGCLEVIERDSFLLTWYARPGLPRLDLDTLTDPTIRLLVERVEHQTGYTLHAFNATLDHALPCICLLGIDEDNREDMPKLHALSGSHPHPEQALLRGLREFVATTSAAHEMYKQGREQARAMLADGRQVKTMFDHPLVYYLPEAFERLHFLYRTPRRQTFQEAFATFYQQPSDQLDLKEDIEQLIQYYLQRNIDTIVVDQTAPEHLHTGMCCVKVLMPGMLPMTFGQHNRRITGFSRLHQVPYALGYQDHPLTVDEINPYPHPFF
ncbi:TOMM precursor leader peptide-binding protein [Dictyobacter aurantiacus]|uniref:SagD family biosynthesis docking scaffold protein n=1 Tax=Dictyobacter aurantiacus TaxID=1936993 RepID=A0A401ZMI5_9CHLR|nr:TOMM precursor leader peptide-binding protein [Dictyobacter aurantiacus]GCE08030.1 SagD family biosynthesis docking scaffold protein [Dictyobacter aurantiacus]